MINFTLQLRLKITIKNIFKKPDKSKILYYFIYFGIILRSYWSKYNGNNHVDHAEGLMNTARHDMAFSDELQGKITFL